jgi:WD40-like Beta Propeller Repeat
MRTKLLSLYLFGLSAAYIQAQTVIETAHAAYNSRRFSDAISLYEQGLASNPGDMEAQMNLANAYKITNNPQKSALWFERVLKNPDALANYPLVPFFYGEVLKMLEDYDKAKQIYPKLPSEYQSVIDVCLQSCNFANANNKDLGIFKVRAEQQVNTEHAEYAPAFYKNKLVFASSRPVKSPLGDDVYTDNTVNFPYLVDKSSKGVLSNPNPVFKYNGMNNNGDPVSFTKDGKRVAYMINSFTGGLRHLPEHNIRTGDIEFANVGAVEEEWTRDQETDVFPHFRNMDGVAKGFPCLTPDGKTMYFAANPNSGFGGFDIFVSFFKNGVWSEPQNLGANVNTAGDEICPFIASDGTLYFSSNFHKGFGGYDIYKSELEGKVWKKVRSLGKGVNSASDDLYFVIDDVANQAYFASNRVGGVGDYDIYEADLVGDESRLPFVLEIPPQFW